MSAHAHTWTVMGNSEESAKLWLPQAKAETGCIFKVRVPIN